VQWSAQRQRGVGTQLLRDEADACRGVRVRIDDAGDDGLAADVDALGAGRDRRSAPPTAAMRLPSMTITPLSITPPSALAMVTILAPTSATVPSGRPP
jgi:hypothetical protein